MSADGFTTNDIFFAATLMYLYGYECLRKVEKPEGRATFTLAVPSMGAKDLLSDYKAGQLAISDVLSLARNHGNILRILSDLKREAEGETTWEAPRTDEWWANARAAAQRRQHERDQRESRPAA